MVLEMDVNKVDEQGDEWFAGFGGVALFEEERLVWLQPLPIKIFNPH